MKKYSYENFLECNRIYSGSCPSYTVRDITEDSCNIYYAASCFPSSIEEVINKVLKGRMTLKNPQMLKKSKYFGNVKYTWYLDRDYDWKGSPECNKTQINIASKVVYNSEYEVLLGVLYYLFFGDPMGIGEIYQFGSKRKAHNIVSVSFFKNPRGNFRYIYWGGCGFKVTLNYKIENRKNIYAVVKLQDSAPIIVKIRIRLVELNEEEVEKCKKEKWNFCTSKDLR